MGYLKGFSCPASFSVDPIPLASHCLLKKTGERVIHPLITFVSTISVSELLHRKSFFVDLHAILYAVLHEAYTYIHTLART